MANIVYPSEKDFRRFIEIIKNGNFRIKRYLPSIDDEWYKIICECIDYVKNTSYYENKLSTDEIAAKILYKVTKKHDLGDGNKRSGVISVYLFCILNDYSIKSPQNLKEQAKRIASTKGRKNEDLMKSRVAKSLKEMMYHIE